MIEPLNQANGEVATTSPAARPTQRPPRSWPATTIRPARQGRGHWRTPAPGTRRRRARSRGPADRPSRRASSRAAGDGRGSRRTGRRPARTARSPSRWDRRPRWRAGAPGWPSPITHGTMRSTTSGRTVPARSEAIRPGRGPTLDGERSCSVQWGVARVRAGRCRPTVEGGGRRARVRVRSGDRAGTASEGRVSVRQPTVDGTGRARAHDGRRGPVSGPTCGGHASGYRVRRPSLGTLPAHATPGGTGVAQAFRFGPNAADTDKDRAPLGTAAVSAPTGDAPVPTRAPTEAS